MWLCRIWTKEETPSLWEIQELLRQSSTDDKRLSSLFEWILRLRVKTVESENLGLLVCLFFRCNCETGTCNSFILLRKVYWCLSESYTALKRGFTDTHQLLKEDGDAESLHKNTSEAGSSKPELLSECSISPLIKSRKCVHYKDAERHLDSDPDVTQGAFIPAEKSHWVVAALWFTY